MRSLIRKTAVVLGVSVVVVVGGLANAGQAQAQPAAVAIAPAAVPACVDSLPPTGGFYRDVRYYNPNACGKCQAAGASYEALGKWDAHCQNIYNQAGTLHAVQLYLRCIACRNEQ